VKCKSRVKTQRKDERPEDPAKVTLSKEHKATRRTIREERIRRADRKGALKKSKSLKRAERRARNRKKRNVSSLIIALKGLGPTQEKDQTTRRKRKIPPTRMPMRIKGGRIKRSKVRNAKHGQEGQRKGQGIERSQRQKRNGPE
jgi:hypothetical protein